MSRSIRIIAVLALVMAALAMPALARAYPKLLVSSAVATPGDTVSFTIFLKNDGQARVSALSTDISFDSMSLTFQSAASGPAASDAGKELVSNLSGASTLRIGLLSFANNNALADGEVATITMSVNAAAQTGLYTLAQTVQGSDPSGADLSIQANTGVLTVADTATIDVHRFTHKGNGSMFFTTDSAEKDWIISELSAVYDYDGVRFKVKPRADAGEARVFRFFNTGNGIHMYTSDAAEAGWIKDSFAHINYEGFTYYASATEQPGTVPLYRVLNLDTYAHLYTTDTAEQAALLASGNMKDEGVAYYVYPADSAQKSRTKDQGRSLEVVMDVQGLEAPLFGTLYLRDGEACLRLESSDMESPAGAALCGEWEAMRQQ